MRPNKQPPIAPSVLTALPEKGITVTQPYLPPLVEFIPYLEKIWENKWLTNNGPYHQQLEKELSKHLEVEHISLFVNGTIALVTALQTLRITGEVITTPYSFVATSHSLLWNNLKPVFVDIDRDTLNIDPEKIERAITAETTAILAVHCYGCPCAVERIQKIADTYGLKVIYDAAHAFGVRYKGKSILDWGDLSVLSFHATKVYNTFEGGAIISREPKLKQRIDFLKNFGFADEVTIMAPGINGKMNEVQAAFGLLQLKHLGRAINSRKLIAEYYRKALVGIKGLGLLPAPLSATENYSYFPVLIGPEFPMSRDKVYLEMRREGIYARRYFFPLISDMPMYKGGVSSPPDNLKVASMISKQVLCLPIYPDLSMSDQQKVINLLSRCAGHG